MVPTDLPLCAGFLPALRRPLFTPTWGLQRLSEVKVRPQFCRFPSHSLMGAGGGCFGGTHHRLQTGAWNRSFNHGLKRM